MRAMSLDDYGKVEEENELNNIKKKLESTNTLVLNLNKQLDELKEIVSWGGFFEFSVFSS
jgi:hypothetical protein